MLNVADDGLGMPAVKRPGMGLDNMRERLSELGGELRIARCVPRGTRIVALLPRADHEAV